ncbi:MAG TPA: hypothetical protein VG796_16240 [Verrucomicrobiales bacterium]|nr:hypothetical protein [Verrucomicrobiales bacterium]
MSAEPFPATTPLKEFENLPDSAICKIDEADSPWGDYGRILIHGMSAHLGRKGGESDPIQYERTGPFVPPITFPGIRDIIVTDAMKQAMEAAGFRGISFRTVILAHIVEVPWHTWDIKAEEPKYFPEGGEPEEYILAKANDPVLARQIGPLWEVVVQEGSEKDCDMFKIPGSGRTHVSGRARLWFQKYFSRWTSFEPAPTPNKGS